MLVQNNWQMRKLLLWFLNYNFKILRLLNFAPDVNFVSNTKNRHSIQTLSIWARFCQYLIIFLPLSLTHYPVPAAAWTNPRVSAGLPWCSSVPVASWPACLSSTPRFSPGRSSCPSCHRWPAAFVALFPANPPRRTKQTTSAASQLSVFFTESSLAIFFLLLFFASYQNLSERLFLLLQSLSYMSVKTLELHSSEGGSVVSLHLQIRWQRANLNSRKEPDINFLITRRSVI